MNVVLIIYISFDLTLLFFLRRGSKARPALVAFLPASKNLAIYK